MSNAPSFEVDMAAFWADPYPTLARLRQDAPIAFVRQLGAVLFTRRDDIFECEKRIDIFSSHQPQGLMNKLMGHNMMRKDGDAHMRERQVFFSAISPKAVKRHWTAQFQAHADRLLDALDLGRPTGLLRDFALPFSGECLKTLTGLTNITFHEMNAWSQGMIDGIANYVGDKEVEARCHRATAAIDAAIDERAPILSREPDGKPARRHARLGHAHGKRARQHQARDWRRPERAARRGGRDCLGVTNAPRSTRPGARRRSLLAAGV
jgi:cytochrome P450